jgi:hypothetical protein
VAVNKPQRIQKGDPGYGRKKFKVLASEGGKTKSIMFGDPNMTIKKNIPERRKSFRARHGCDTKDHSKLSAAYWACKAW